jgi:hypothetical protein
MNQQRQGAPPMVRFSLCLLLPKEAPVLFDSTDKENNPLDPHLDDLKNSNNGTGATLVSKSRLGRKKTQKEESM